MFQIQLDGVESAVFVQRKRTEKQAENVAIVQNGRAKTAVSRQFKQNVTVSTNNYTREQSHSHLCSKPYLFVLKYFM
jgi:hypothetical protein